MKITPKILVAFLVLSITPLAATAYLVTANATLTLEDQVLDQLDAVASVQKSRLNDSIAQNLERLALVSSRTQLRIALDNYTRDPQQKYVDQMNRILLDARSSVASFRQVHVLVLNGTTVSSTDPAAIGTNHSSEAFFLRGRTESTVDIFFLNASQQLGVYLSGPLTFNSTAIGVLVIESGVENVLSMVEEYSGLGESGETELAERTPDGGARFLAPARFDLYSALNRTISGNETASPLIMALAGEETLLAEVTDYRGVRVLAATRFISQTGWGLVVKIDRSEAFAPVAGLQGLMVAIIGLSSAVIATLSVYVARSITRPLRDVAGVAGRISDGELDRRVSVGSKDEIGDLALSFNQMTQKLVESNVDLERKVRERTAKLEEEIGQRTRAEEALRLQAAELAAANKELEAFSYSVSHDLRAPLRSMDGFSQALLEDYRDQLDAQGADYLVRVRTASQRMARLIDDMLGLARVTRAPLHLEVVDVSALAAGLANELRSQGPDRTVDVAIAPGLRARADPALLRIALENLLGNAWKFSSPRPTARVEVGSIRVDGEPAFFVRDDGVGFDMAYVDKLFGAFQRLHSESQFPGTGIGLATVARIVHRHGGRVWAESEVGRGATFYFTLPEERGRSEDIHDEKRTIRSE